MRWALRSATAADEEILYEIHRGAMRAHVEPVWGWDEADQRARFHAAFDPAHLAVITVDGRSLGLLRVEDRPDEVVLAIIELAPEVQGHGLGGEIVRHVVDQAAARGVGVRLQVLRNNPARRLYERQGFRAVGETDTHVEMMRPHAEE